MDNDKIEEQLKRAYELRDFEIEMYWKRAQYFWGFLAVIYAGFFILVSKKDENALPVEFLLIICSVGCLFSLAWYLVNRGSKRWQEHWENIINDLEEKLNKPLYIIKPEVDERIFNAGNFSVSRINIAVSFLVFISWLGLWFLSTFKDSSNYYSACIIGFLTIIGLFLIYFLGKGKK